MRQYNLAFGLIFISLVIFCTADNPKENMSAAQSTFSEYVQSHGLNASKLLGPKILKGVNGITIYEWWYINQNVPDTARVRVHVYKDAFKEPDIDASGNDSTWMQIRK